MMPRGTLRSFRSVAVLVSISAFTAFEVRADCNSNSTPCAEETNNYSGSLPFNVAAPAYVGNTFGAAAAIVGGDADFGAGVGGASSSGAGVWGISSTGEISPPTNAAYGIYGWTDTGGGIGVYAESLNGDGVQGTSYGYLNNGVYGYSYSGYGVSGSAETNTGVYGFSASGDGVDAISNGSGYGVSAYSASNYAINAVSGSTTAIFGLRDPLVCFLHGNLGSAA